VGRRVAEIARGLVDLLESPATMMLFRDHVRLALECWPGNPVDLWLAIRGEQERRGATLLAQF
jgi:hypothetical protein